MLGKTYSVLGVTAAIVKFAKNAGNKQAKCLEICNISTETLQ
jgi:hypothetical protein